MWQALTGVGKELREKRGRIGDFLGGVSGT